MNFKTTLALIVLVAAGGGWYLYRETAADRTAADAADSQTLNITRHDFQPDRIAKIEIVRPTERITFLHGKGWSLEGSWPARTPEVQQIVDVVAGLSSRFEPIFASEQLKYTDYGLAREQNPVQVIVTTRGADRKEQSHTLLFGEPPNDPTGNPFTRPTYMRMDGQPEVIRLAPGVKAILNRPRSTYFKRQLFPEIERVKLDALPSLPGAPELSAPVALLLDAQQVTATGPGGNWTLKRTGPRTAARTGVATDMTLERLGERWALTAPVSDRVDPDKLKSVLASVPELWVERFVEDPGVEKTGLAQPERTVTVEFDDRPSVKLLIGNLSRVEERKVAPPTPPNPFAPPPPAPPPIREEFRFAKLPDNSQVFEVKTDRLADVFVTPVALRDPRLFRFKTNDVKRIEIVRGTDKTILTKDDSRWKLLEPIQVDADAPRVNEFLDKLADLQASGADLLDPSDLKPLALDNPDGAHVTITVGEKDKPESKWTLKIGKHESDKKKLAVQAVGNARVAMVNDEFWKLFDRSALAYRGKRLLDIPASKIATLAIQRPGEQFSLSQANGGWSLTSPVAATADSTKVGIVAGDLVRLDAVEFVADAPKPEELPRYGLDRPTATATLTFSDGTAPKSLQLGVGRDGKPEVYAKLTDSPMVFTVRTAIRDGIDQSSLSFLPLQVWQFTANDVAILDVTRGDETYKLTKAPPVWKLSGPFDGAVSVATMQTLLPAAANLRAERYETHKADDLSKYGLVRPQLKLGVASPQTAKSVLIGKPTADGAKSRFAKLSDGDAIFVVSDTLIAPVDRPAIDLLDRQLLSIGPDSISEVKGTSSEGDWALRRGMGGWSIQSLNPPLAADSSAVEESLRAWANLQATRFLEIGPKTDFARYGLDRPRASATVVATVEGGQPVMHTVSVGDKARDTDAYFVRLDQTLGVAELPASAVKQIIHGELDFVNRDLLKFDPAHLTGIKRRGGDELELAKTSDGWTIVKPAGMKLDQVGFEELIERLSHLRAVRVISLDAKDPSRYGFESPTVVTLALKNPDGQTPERTLEIGRLVSSRYEEPAGSRYVRLGGASLVGILAPDVANRLSGAPFTFRDRLIAQFSDADRAILERGSRRVTFAKADGTWKMAEPIATDAETADLDDLANALGRLRADELVAERPTDLKAFGLDTPSARWRLMNGEREVLNLLVGKRDATTGRCFAKLADGDVVFLVDSLLSSRLMSEYRKRTLWPAVDPAQVETLIYGVGDKTVVFQKVDNNWQLPGKPDQPLNAPAINDLLTAFAGLKVERFVADKDADLKALGFLPPSRTIVVRPRSGNPQTLYLGATEPGAKRLYARIYDPNRSDVFVLSESDSMKLLRELTEFGIR